MNNSTLQLLRAVEKGYYVDAMGMVFNRKKMLKRQYVKSTGYLCFSMKYNNKNCFVRTHRLQAFQKYGEKIFEHGLEVRHIDNNKLNNSYDNIVLGTHSENMMDRPEHMRKKCALNAGIKNSPLTAEDVMEIRKLYKTGEYTYLYLAKMFGLKSKGTISDIINNKVWMHVK